MPPALQDFSSQTRDWTCGPCRGTTGLSGKFLIKLFFKLSFLGFLGGSVVKNLPANARYTGSIPGSGKIPHASEQLSPCATTTQPSLYNREPQPLKPVCPGNRALQPRTTATKAGMPWSPIAYSREPQLPKPVCPGARALKQETPLQWEDRAPQPEKAHTGTKIQHSQKINKQKNYFKKLFKTALQGIPWWSSG